MYKTYYLIIGLLVASQVHGGILPGMGGPNPGPNPGPNSGPNPEPIPGPNTGPNLGLNLPGSPLPPADMFAGGPAGPGVDPTFAASVDPSAAAAAAALGVDPNAAAAATLGIDPNFAASVGIDPSFATSVGVDPNVVASVGFGPSVTGVATDPYVAECLRQGCRETCYIPHPSSCFKFIVCQPASGEFYAQEMLCAFGTMWKVGTEPVCDVPELAGCINDRCKNPNILSYTHEDSNCRTFWSCENGRSVASCCGLYQRYVGNGFNGTCVDDVTCDKPCPLLNDASCRSFGVTSLNFPDGNCKTHFDCAYGRPHPVCCKEGQGYDVFKGICVPDLTCKQPCPVEYQGMCKKLNATSYSLMDGNCRTYMKCNGLGQDEPHCCRTGHMYDRQLKMCISGSFPYECENANCPLGYIEECAYESVPTDPYVFKNLDAHGGQLMSCAVGTKYNPIECRCSLDPDFFTRAKIASQACGLAIDVNLPHLKNRGTAAAAVLMIGDYGQGEKGVGNMEAIWTGQDGINIPYYGGQELPSFFLEITFTPTDISPIPQILLSSCYYDQAGVPSLEIRLLPSANGTGTLNYNVVDKLGTSRLQAAIPYQIGLPYVYRVIYDGRNMGVHLENIGGITISDSNVFSGDIPIYRSGLRFAHCRYEQNVLSFIGTVNSIKFSKCIDDIMMNMLYPTPGVI